MQGSTTIPLSDLVKHFELDILYKSKQYDETQIKLAAVNRPGLQLAGFYDYFVADRLQVIGLAEATYLGTLTAEGRRHAFATLFSTGIPALVICHKATAYPECMEVAAEYQTTILRSGRATSDFMAAGIAWLKLCLAPCITRHGVFVEVYGEGLLFLGESGVGKSEAAIELVKRGHRLIADDAVEIRRTSDIALVGSAPESIRHYIELRGIGIIDVRHLFGVGAVKPSERLNLVIHLEAWKDGALYDRLGIDEQFTEILGIQVPSLTVPVKDGRNLAVISEVAAMNNRQKKIGYNSAVEFTRRLDKFLDPDAPR